MANTVWVVAVFKMYLMKLRMIYGKALMASYISHDGSKPRRRRSRHADREPAWRMREAYSVLRTRIRNLASDLSEKLEMSQRP